MEQNSEKLPCPEFPFFGAKYPDARCIDGKLWDLDSDENGVFTVGGDCPCPFCNKSEFLCMTGWDRDYYDLWVKKMRDRYQ